MAEDKKITAMIRVQPALMEKIDKLAEELSMKRTEVINYLIARYYEAKK